MRVIVLADDPSYDQSLAKRSAALRFAEVLWLPVAPEHLAARVFAHLRAQQEDAVTGTPTPPPRGELSSGSSSNSSRFGAPTPPRSSGESARSWSSNDSTGESTQPAPYVHPLELIAASFPAVPPRPEPPPPAGPPSYHDQQRRCRSRGRVRPVRYGSCPSLLGTVVVENRYAESGQSRERTAARARNVAMALRREFEKVCSSPLAANRIQTAFPEQDAESSGGPPAAGRMVAPQNPGGSGGGKGGGGMLPRGPAGVAANDAAGPLPRLSWRRLSIGGQIVGAVALAATAGATATALFYEYTAPCA